MAYFDKHNICLRCSLPKSEHERDIMWEEWNCPKAKRISIFGTKGPSLDFLESDNDLYKLYEVEERELREKYAKLLQERRIN
jgi:hypothetical protein